MQGYAKLALALALALLAALAFCSCASRQNEPVNAAPREAQSAETPPEEKPSAKTPQAPAFSELLGKNWILAEARVKPDTLIFELNPSAGENARAFFTLTFDAERVSGVGAPNRYFAPYTLGEQNAISISTTTGTRMALLQEPEGLKENDFFAWLENTERWNLANGKLELHTKGINGEEMLLVFALAD